MYDHQTQHPDFEKYIFKKWMMTLYNWEKNKDYHEQFGNMLGWYLEDRLKNDYAIVHIC